MFIKSLDLQDFKGIRKCSSPLELNRINILIGRNNSGKTSILEALYLFPHPHLKDKSFYESTKYSFVTSMLSSSKALSYKYSGKARLVFNINDEHNELSKSQNWTVVIDADNGSADAIDRSAKKNPEDIKMGPNILFPASLDVFDRQNSIDQYLERNENEIIKRGNHKKVAEAISGIVPDEFTEIFTKKDGWYFRRKDASHVHIKDVGAGVKKAVRVMLAAENIDPWLLLWDDFDTYSHPSLTAMLLHWLYDHKNWQVVLTTHSIDVLYRILELSPANDVSIIQVSKTNEDEMRFRSMTLDELEVLIDSNIDPRLLSEDLKV